MHAQLPLFPYPALAGNLMSANNELILQWHQS